jgi:hypothetical protein
MLMKRIELPLALISASAAGAFLFSADQHTDDTGIIAGLIFIFASVVACLFRKAGLICGSMIGLSIVASAIWNPRSHTHTFGDFALLFLVVSAISVLGSLAGFGLRRVLRQDNPAR